jgi:hypothetical protein
VVGTIFCSHIDKWWVPYFVHTLISGGKIWHPPRSMCEQNMVPTMYQCVNKIWYPPLINVWIKYGTHHLSMCEQNMVPTIVVGTIFYSHIDTWWVPYFVHTLISGGYHILFTHWYVVGTIFYSHIDTWWVPYFIPLINVWTKYGTHHVSMCE